MERVLWLAASFLPAQPFPISLPDWKVYVLTLTVLRFYQLLKKKISGSRHPTNVYSGSGTVLRRRDTSKHRERLCSSWGLGQTHKEQVHHMAHGRSTRRKTRLLQEGGPLPGPESGLLSNTWK